MLNGYYVIIVMQDQYNTPAAHRCSNRGYAWSKNRHDFFLTMLDGEWLVDLKHKPLEDKEVTKIVGH